MLVIKETFLKDKDYGVKMAAECLGMKYWLGWQNQHYKLAGVFEWYHKIISSVDII